jgi:uncharacterized protein involved in outer membrane biogenesis
MKLSRKAILRLAIYLPLGLGLLLTLGALLLSQVAERLVNQYKPDIESLLSETARAKVELGALKLSLLPSLHVETESVLIHGPLSRALEVGGLSLGLSLSDLLAGHIDVTYLELDRPTIHLQVEAGKLRLLGRPFAAAAEPNSTAPQHAGASTPSIDLDHVSLRHASITISNAALGLTQEIRELTLLAKLYSAQGNHSVPLFSLNAHTGSKTQMRVDGRMQYRERMLDYKLKLELRDFEIQPWAALLERPISVVPAGESFNLKFTGEGRGANLNGGLELTSTGAGMQLHESLIKSVDAKLTFVSQDDSAQLKIEHMRALANEVPVSIEGSLSGPLDELNLSEARIKLPKSEFKVTAQLLEKETLEARITSEQADIGELLVVAKPSQAKLVSGALQKFEADLTGPLSSPLDMRAQGSLQALNLNGNALETVRAIMAEVDAVSEIFSNQLPGRRDAVRSIAVQFGWEQQKLRLDKGLAKTSLADVGFRGSYSLNGAVAMRAHVHLGDYREAQAGGIPVRISGRMPNLEIVSEATVLDGLEGVANAGVKVTENLGKGLQDLFKF